MQKKMRKKLIIANLFLFMFIPLLTNAEELEERWITYDRPFFGVASTTNGGYVAVSENGNIVKYDRNGEIQWQKKFEVYFNNIIATPDDGYIAVGYTDSTNIEGVTNQGGYDAYIVKVDKDGNVVWQNGNGREYYDRYDGVTTTTDGGYVAVGFTNSIDELEYRNGDGDAFIVKYDKNGNIEWQNKYGGTTGWQNNHDYNSGDRFFDVISTSDDGCIVIGSVGSIDIEGLPTAGKDDGVIIKYDANGDIVWQKSYGGSNHEYFYDITTTIDGNYAVVGQIYSTDIEGITNKGSEDAIVVTYDKDGNIKWQTNYGGSHTDEFSGIATTPDGGFVVVGSTLSSDIEGITNNDRQDAIIVKYDKDGNIEWQTNYGGDNYDSFNKVTTTTDNGYVVVGSTSKGKLLNLFIKYNLITNETTNGTFEVVQEGKKGIITINPKEGYILDKITIKDSEGNTIKYYEENGYYYFDLSSDVTIEILFKEIVNPNTGINNPYIVSILILLISSITIYLIRTKKYI